MKLAFITGVTGQDGSFMAEFLLNKTDDSEWEYPMVYGFARRASTPNTKNIVGLLDKPRFQLLYGDVTDIESIIHALKIITTEQSFERLEIYNFAAQSFVHVSFESPEYTAQVDGVGVLKLLEAVRALNLVDKTRFFQASTSEMYGKVQETPQSETTPFYPRSPYGVAKLFGYWTVRNYRESYGMFASNVIAFNHESVRRGSEFVTRKITMAVARIMKGTQDCLYLGNINALRDWGNSDDYCEAIYLVMQHREPDDFVVSTGENHSVREFVELAFAAVGKTVEWQGEGINEVGVVDGVIRVRISEKYYRPCEVETLLGDPSKAKQELNWEPKKSFTELVKEMVDHDMKYTV